ncbi:MAG: glutamine synthetase III family protein [Planctomycetota bacterium]|jgi:glutamine synthetase
MKGLSARQHAVDVISQRSHYDGRVDYTVTSIKEVFADHVFTENVQLERLPKDVFQKLQKTIKAGETLDATIADAVAIAMRDWAIEHGATHFTHWFQPMTGATAEKHDSFITPTADGGVLAQFSGRELIMGEPDASSFPSGGLRATFEARGYTAWDPSSPAFLLENPNGTTLIIPTMFMSWSGDALGKKIPLLRSQEVIGNHAMRILRLFGSGATKQVFSTIGSEQEYFLVDKLFYHARPDLINTGRTLFGAKPPKGQELDDQYFGAINERVLTIMSEVEYELLKLGVPIKTRHNEVAPGQYEIAPTFEPANLAVDHNLLIMDTLRRVANRHGMACLLHEKPFAGINGSGKHHNWSINTDDGKNLLKPGSTPHANAQFLVFCAAVCDAVHRNGHLLRLSICGAGNDHRLGANEAPPAIISVFLGSQLDEIFEDIAAGKATSSRDGGHIELGVSMLPKLRRDPGDRNRTSPFAFTSNRFEFRAVGSSQNPSGPNTVLNAIVSEVLDEYATVLEKAVEGGQDVEAAAQALLAERIPMFKPVLFLGDNYATEWHTDAVQRGLRDLPTTPEVLATLNEPGSRAVLTKYGIYTERELESRKEILCENYATARIIEAETAMMMAKTLILPAALSYQTEVAHAVGAVKSAGLHEAVQEAFLREVIDLTSGLRVKVEELEVLLAAVPEDDALEAARYSCDTILAKMDELRAVGDKLEGIIPDHLWPLPTYREMLFIR